jgi:hypothetical protein
MKNWKNISHPVFKDFEEAEKEYKDKSPKRFHIKPDMEIELFDGSRVAVCNQWGVDNIYNFIHKAEGLGYTIEKEETKTGPSSDGERQCRVCGEWKSMSDHFRYTNTSRKHYWCEDCNKEYHRHNAEEGDGAGKLWIKEQQKTWDYAKGKTNPDR